MSVTVAPKDRQTGSEGAALIQTKRMIFNLLLFSKNVFSSGSSGPDNCCFKFFPGTLSASRIRSFILTDDRCPKPGVVFVTRRNLNICVEKNATWVQEVLQTLVN
uniref:C-C motif chemokine n=1 Tax=Oryzias latipes TaxID=8090 RepID=A0A3P9KX09_ORYLA